MLQLYLCGREIKISIEHIYIICTFKATVKRVVLFFWKITSSTDRYCRSLDFTFCFLPVSIPCTTLFVAIVTLIRLDIN